MRFLPLLLITAAAVTAQSPLTTTFVSNNGGAAGGAVYFDLTNTSATTALTITALDLNISTLVGTVGTMKFFSRPGTSVGFEASPVGWVLTASGSVTSAGTGLPSAFPLTPAVVLPPSTTIGVALHSAPAAPATLAHRYTNGAVNPTFFSTCHLLMAAGKASNVAFAGTPFSPRLVNCNIHFTTTAACATVVSQGPGCLAQFASFYENFATAAAFDLSGGAISIANTGSGRLVTAGGTYNPVGSLAPATPLVLTDDSAIAAGTLGLVVGSNGWVALAAGNSLAFAGTPALLLGNPATAFYSWHDLNPTIVGSGLVQYEELGPLAQITFDGVWDFGGTSVADANNIQFQINTATGNVTICWGPMSVLGASGTGHLVGFSPGGPSANPGNSDLSTLGSILTSTTDLLPLRLTGVGRPVEGPLAVNYDVTTSNIAPGAGLHIGIVGLSRPALPLSLIGAPGCFLNASMDILVGPVVLPGPSVTWTTLTLPAVGPSNIGFEFNAQGAILGTPLNPALGFGVLTSNGLKMTVGDV